MGNIIVLCENDAQALEQLDKQIFGSGAYSQKSIQDELHNNGRLYLFYMEKNSPIGFVGCSVLPDESADVMKVGVLKEFRGRKIGTKLLIRLIELLGQKDVKRIMLEVDEENSSAINLYENCGFKKVSVRKNYYPNGHDACIYEFDIE